MAIFLLIDNNISDETVAQTPSQKRAATGAIVMIYFSGFGWALGWNSIQYLINSEIYPLRLRALGGSIAMTFHFVNQYGNSKISRPPLPNFPRLSKLTVPLRSSPNVHQHDDRRHNAILQLCHSYRACLGVVLPPGNHRKEFGGYGRDV